MPLPPAMRPQTLTEAARDLDVPVGPESSKGPFETATDMDAEFEELLSGQPAWQTEGQDAAWPASTFFRGNLVLDHAWKKDVAAERIARDVRIAIKKSHLRCS